MIGAAVETEVRHGHLFCGIGGGAKGFNRGHARVGNVSARFRCVGGIDVDAPACRDFERNVRARASCLDLFSLEQYRDFHGREPPPGWEEMGPTDVVEAFDARPHIVFLSAPCKGFSGLLSEAASRALKYQALNGLTLRGIDLLLRAYADDPVELIIFENVPRIASRGAHLVDDIVARFRRAGYAAAVTTHDCGELGNLAQSRKRFLLVARHEAKIPAFLHEPVKHPLRGVGEVLDLLPLPLSGAGGPMHRMPRLQWQTWVRLAFVVAGEDWRSLNGLAVEDGFLRDYGIVPAAGWHNGAFGVNRWDAPAGAVTTNGFPSGGSHSVADPRVPTRWHGDALGVREWGGPTGVVPGRSLPTNGAHAVADPRPGNLASSDRPCYGVGAYTEPAGTLTGARSPGQGRFAVADPRPPDGSRGGKYRVTEASEPAGTVISASTTGNGAFAVADCRVAGHEKSSQLGVRPWGATGPVVTGNMAAGAGPNSIADPRLQGGPRFNSLFRIVGWGDHAVAVSGPGGAGGPAVADPRTGYGEATHHNVLQVQRWERHAKTITGSNHPSGGALSVADPRFDWHPGASSSKLRITEWDGNARPITGAQQVASGAGAVADPRPACLQDRDGYVTAGHYGVVRYDQTGYAVTAAGQHDNGFNSVADPRALASNEGEKSDMALPSARDRLVCVIVARDGTWHRPFTTLELAALQGLVDPEEQFELDGLSDAAWRERIGNCVPPPSAEAIAGVMGETLLLAWAGETFRLSNTPIWVRNVAAGLSLQPQKMVLE